MAKILVVDDEAIVVEILTKRLKAKGYAVISARDGVEGYKKATEERVDLILLDVIMPNCDGFTMLQKLRSNESTCRTPVIMLTAKTELDSIIQAKNLLADYILKPIDFDALLKYIRKYIGFAM